MRRLTYGIAFLFVLFMASTAFGQVKFNQVVTFGDSLTQNDLLGIVSQKPQDMYGRDPMQAVFRKRVFPNGRLNSYAIAGSQSNEIRFQIDLYTALLLAGVQKKASLISFEIGGNDILNNIDLLAGNAPGESVPADAVTADIIKNIRRSWNLLQKLHPKAQFLIWTLPDVTLTPKHIDNLTLDEASHVRAHISRVNQFIRSLARNRAVAVFDLYTFVQQFAAVPIVVANDFLVPSPAFGDYDHIFADEIHPTAVSNALIANAIIEVINRKWRDAIPIYSQEELAALARIGP